MNSNLDVVGSRPNLYNCKKLKCSFSLVVILLVWTMIKGRNSLMNKFAMCSSPHHRSPNIWYSSSRRFQHSFVGFQGATSLRTACRSISGRHFSGREATTVNKSAVRRLGCNLMSAQLKGLCSTLLLLVYKEKKFT